MIKKMRFKFIAITMGALVLLLVSILATTNIVMNNNNERSTDELLQSLVISDGEVVHQPGGQGQPGGHPPAEQQDLIEAFSVKVDENNDVLKIMSYDLSDEEEIYDLISAVIEKDKDSGKIGDYKYIVAEKDYGKIIVFANQSIQNELLNQLKDISYVIGIISIVVLSVIVFFLSKLVTRPIEESFDKQKRFVSDSGHELKTPLSILSANADMMEMELGKNEWLTQIKQQSTRMNKLIHELLILAKTEDMNINTQFMEFNLSQTVLNTVLPLEMVAFENDKQISCEIEDDVMLKGNEKRIVEMIEALLDNAIKYSKEKSTINVKLKTKGGKKILEVCNEGRGINEEDKQKLFEKFYRADDSRARETGGYGLGLSIVKNIVDLHKGKIEIDTKSKELIVFRITFS